jgi:multiple antibiotic resistance protein
MHVKGLHMYKSRAGNDQGRRAQRLAALACVGCFVAASAAYGTTVADADVPTRQLALGQFLPILILMLGPFKIIGPFFKVTNGANATQTRQIAVWATIFAALGLLIAGFLGESILGSYGIPLPILVLSGGVILFLVALRNVLGQFEAHEPPSGEAKAPPAPAMKVALMPLAFPAIVTPYGIAALIVLFAFSDGQEGRLTLAAAVVAIMVLNLIVMLAARRLAPVLAFVLPILGAVLGVVQVALGLQIINNALQMLGVL